MATTQDISLDANGKVVVGKSKKMQSKTDAQLDRAMQAAVKTNCDPGKAYPIPVQKV